MLNVIVFETCVVGCVKQGPEAPSRDSFGEVQMYNKQPPNSFGKQGFCRHQVSTFLVQNRLTNSGTT